MISRLRITTLGNFGLHYQENLEAATRPLPTPPTLKSQSLLAWLIVNRQLPHPRERLIGMFWSDRPEQKARRSLSTALWHIRRCFPGEDPIRGYSQSVQFDYPGEIWLDTEAFEARASHHDRENLQAAVSHYQGEFLADFYDEWVVTTRYYLQSLFIEVLTNLMQLHEAADDHELALNTTRRLLQIDPLREKAHRVAMRACCALGLRNAALEQYQLCRQIVHKELGVDPMPETTNLFRSILDGQHPIGRPHPVIVASTEKARIPGGRSPLDVAAREVMVGRAAEMAFLNKRWAASQAGQGGFTLVQGEVGIGKSLLLEQFANKLRVHGSRVLWGRCYEFERLLPYQPLAEALRPWLTGLPAKEWNRIPEWVFAELGRLAPEILAEPRRLFPNETGHDQSLLFTAVLHFLSVLSENGPLLIVLEDLHWASASTLELLHYLLRRMVDRPVLLVGTNRTETSEQQPLQTILRQLSRDGLVDILSLGRLTRVDIEKLVGEMSGVGEKAAPLAWRLFKETEGNSFFLVETIKTLFETKAITVAGGIWQGDFERISRGDLPLPTSISEVIQARMSRLDEATQDALRLAAVLGREFDYEPFAAAWDRGKEATLDAIDELLRNRIIDEGRGTTDRDYTFTHHKIQEVVYAGIARQRRQHTHSQVGMAMERCYAPGLDEAASELAYHFEQAQSLDRNLTEKAIHYLKFAGNQAAQQYANVDALAYYNRALALTPDLDYAGRYALLLESENIYDIQGNRDAQNQDLSTLWELAKQLSGKHQAEIMLRRGRFARDIGDFSASVEAAQTAIELAQQGPQAFISEGYLILGQALVRQGAYRTAQTRLEQGLAMARAASSRLLEAHHLNNLGLACNYLGDPKGAQRYLKAASRIYREIGNLRGLSAVLNNLGVIANEQGDNVAARGFYQDALNIHQRVGNRKGEGMLLGNLGVISAAQGVFLQARDDYQGALQIAREIGHHLFEGNALLNLGTVYIYLGAYQEAGECYEDALRVYRQIGNLTGVSWGLVYSGLLAHRQGEQEAGLVYVRDALNKAEEIGDRHIQGYAWTHIGHGLNALGQFDEADEAYRKAFSIRSDLAEMHLAMESLSGMVRTCLRQNRLKDAHAHTGKILAFLKDNSLEGTDEPLRVFLTCYQALHANGDPHARQVLLTAHALLKEQAAKIGDKALRRSFLQDIPAHSDIVDAFSQDYPSSTT